MQLGTPPLLAAPESGALLTLAQLLARRGGHSRALLPSAAGGVDISWLLGLLRLPGWQDTAN